MKRSVDPRQRAKKKRGWNQQTRTSNSQPFAYWPQIIKCYFFGLFKFSCGIFVAYWSVIMLRAALSMRVAAASSQKIYKFLPLYSSYATAPARRKKKVVEDAPAEIAIPVDSSEGKFTSLKRVILAEKPCTYDFSSFVLSKLLISDCSGRQRYRPCS